MATFSYDVTNAPALEMDFPLINDTYALGEWIAQGTTDGTDLGACKSGEGIYDNMIGILADDAITTTGTHTGKNIDEGRVIYNPFGVYMAEYLLTGTDGAVAYTDGTTNTADPVITVADGKGHPNLGGGWLYGTADPNAGELRQVQFSAVSGTAMLVTLQGDPSATFTTNSDVQFIFPPFGKYGVDLTATGIDADDLDSGGGTAGTDGLTVTVMDNWIQYKGRPIERLRAAKHEGLTDLDNLSVRFWSELCLSPSHILTP